MPSISRVRAVSPASASFVRCFSRFCVTCCRVASSSHFAPTIPPRVASEAEHHSHNGLSPPPRPPAVAECSSQSSHVRPDGRCGIGRMPRAALPSHEQHMLLHSYESCRTSLTQTLHRFRTYPACCRVSYNSGTGATVRLTTRSSCGASGGSRDAVTA
jgi:hypothetical protein